MRSAQSIGGCLTTLLAASLSMHCSLLVSTDGLTGGAPSPGPNASNDAGIEGGAVATVPDGGVGFVRWEGNGHTYVCVASASLTLIAADQAARALGGHLATITSAEENAFVTGLSGCGDQIWIGAQQAKGASDPKNGWTWLNGEPFTFSAWAAGQPDDSLGFSDEDAIILERGQWRDDQSTSKHKGYIVEFE